MKKRELVRLLVIVAIVCAIAYAAWRAATIDANHEFSIRAATSDCLRAGYHEIQIVADDIYCIGLRDGNTVTILVSELETGER